MTSNRNISELEIENGFKGLGLGCDEYNDNIQPVNTRNQTVHSAPMQPNPNETYYSNMANRGANHTAPTAAVASSKLNPSAQEFVPRVSSNRYSPNSSQLNSNNSHPSSQGRLNGNANNVQISESGESEIEDYIALSYLKEFISSISNKPSNYNFGINNVTYIVNSYLDEDECVLELIVNQIVDQSIIDVNFRYNGVRLSSHFMESIRPTSSGQTFQNLLFKRCQRECSRKVNSSTSANTFNHLRGLALFTAEVYSRCKLPELGEYLPNLLMNILSDDSKLDENVKCVCQVLKLCGQQLEICFNEKGKDDVKNVFKKLSEMVECDISVYIKEMVKGVIKLSENGWVEPPRANTGIVNPYLNNSAIAENGNVNCNPPPPMYQNNYATYDFGNCGDELDEEVCRDFENFLKQSDS